MHLQAICTRTAPLPAVRTHFLRRLLPGAAAAAAQVPGVGTRTLLQHMRRSAGSAATLPGRYNSLSQQGQHLSVPPVVLGLLLQLLTGPAGTGP